MIITKEVEAISGRMTEYRLGLNENRKVVWIPEFSLFPGHDFESYEEITKLLDMFEDQTLFIPDQVKDETHIYMKDSIGDRTLRYFGTIKGEL